MKVAVRIVCISMIFFAPVARIDAGDDEQTPSLFDQVRDAIPKLGTEAGEMKFRRLLRSRRLRCSGTISSVHTGFTYHGFGKEDQLLDVDTVQGEITDVVLWDGGKIVAEFHAKKK